MGGDSSQEKGNIIEVATASPPAANQLCLIAISIATRISLATALIFRAKDRIWETLHDKIMSLGRNTLHPKTNMYVFLLIFGKIVAHSPKFHRLTMPNIVTI